MERTDSDIWLGIDVGSTTAKIAAVDPHSKELLLRCYRRHNARQCETSGELIAEALKEFPGAAFRAAVCGSGGGRWLTLSAPLIYRKLSPIPWR